MKCTCLVLCLILASPLLALHDFEIWLYSSYETPLRPSLRFSLFGEGRWRKNASRIYDKILEGEFIYKFNKYLEIAPGYRNNWHTPRTNPHTFLQSHIPFVDLFLTFAGKRDTIKYRLRTQYAVRQRRRNDWAIRNRLAWFFPALKRVTPYLMDEIFWRDLDGFFENRLYFGTTFPIKGNFQGETFFMKRDLRFALGWEHDRVLGFRLKYIPQEKKKKPKEEKSILKTTKRSNGTS